MIGVLVSNQVDEAEQRRRLARTYQTIATATGLSSEAGDPLKTLAASIVASPLVDDFRLAGWQWLSTPDRASDGIALIGMTSPSDDGQTLTSDSGRAIPLVGNVEIPTAQEVLVLGKLDPQGTSIEVLHAEPIP